MASDQNIGARIPRAPTIYEVAHAAGVSIKTVSRVLNREPNVRAEVHERVLAVVAELGYRPRTSARGLAGGRSFTLVTFLDEALTMEHWRIDRSNPYVERLQFGGMMACRLAGYHLLFEMLDADAPDAEDRVMSILAALNPDGVILTPPISENPRVLDVLERCNKPYARLGNSHLLPGGISVGMDEARGASEAADHLMNLGHKRIGLITGTEGLTSSAIREQGFIGALEKRGFDLTNLVTARGDYTYETGKSIGADFLAMAEPPTAIFASNDEMALGVIHIANDRGVLVPQDLSVVGFDDFPASRYSHPPLTTVRQPVGDMAIEACRRLIERVGQKRPAAQSEAEMAIVAAPQSSNIIVPHKLITRASTAPPKAR